uniref:Transposase Tc1-like domain-containing protein n=1 Tax=Amphiprion percula TaxID=161767 RepID=A0A3P8RST4_AMPPE
MRNKILWSDESSFQLSLPPANVRVRRRPGKALSPACTVPIVKGGGGSIMVWGCMSAAGVGHLAVCDGTLNSQNTHPPCCTCSVEVKLDVSTRYYPLNTSRASRIWLQEQSIQVLKWPGLKVARS